MAKNKEQVLIETGKIKIVEYERAVSYNELSKVKRSSGDQPEDMPHKRWAITSAGWKFPVEDFLQIGEDIAITELNAVPRTSKAGVYLTELEKKYQLEKQVELFTPNMDVKMHDIKIAKLNDSIVIIDGDKSYIYAGGKMSDAFYSVGLKQGLNFPNNEITSIEGKLFQDEMCPVRLDKDTAVFVDKDFNKIEKLGAHHSIISYVNKDTYYVGNGGYAYNLDVVDGVHGYAGMDVSFDILQNRNVGYTYSSQGDKKGVAICYKGDELNQHIKMYRDMCGNIVSEKELTEEFINRARAFYEFATEGKSIDELDGKYFENKNFADAVKRLIPVRKMIPQGFEQMAYERKQSVVQYINDCMEEFTKKEDSTIEELERIVRFIPFKTRDAKTIAAEIFEDYEKFDATLAELDGYTER